AALQYFMTHQDEQEKSAQTWADKALEQNKVVGNVESLLARMPPGAQATQGVRARLGREQSILAMLTQNAQQHASRAQYFSQQIPPLIAHSAPRGGGGEAAGTEGRPPSVPRRAGRGPAPADQMSQEQMAAAQGPTGAEMGPQQPAPEQLSDVEWWRRELHSV